MPDDTPRAGDIWPPSVATDTLPVPDQDQGRQRRVSQIRSFGHGTALLPVAVFLFMSFWLDHGIYNANLDLIGPAWYTRLGGEDLSLAVVPLCLIGGIGSILAGLMMRQWLTVCEGMWACAATPMLVFLFGIATF